MPDYLIALTAIGLILLCIWYNHVQTQKENRPKRREE